MDKLCPQFHLFRKLGGIIERIINSTVVVNFSSTQPFNWELLRTKDKVIFFILDDNEFFWENKYDYFISLDIWAGKGELFESAIFWYYCFFRQIFQSYWI